MKNKRTTTTTNKQTRQQEEPLLYHFITYLTMGFAGTPPPPPHPPFPLLPCQSYSTVRYFRTASIVIWLQKYNRTVDLARNQAYTITSSTVCSPLCSWLAEGHWKQPPRQNGLCCLVFDWLRATESSHQDRTGCAVLFLIGWGPLKAATTTERVVLSCFWLAEGLLWSFIIIIIIIIIQQLWSPCVFLISNLWIGWVLVAISE